MNDSCCCTTTFRDYVYQCPETLTIFTLNLPTLTDFTVLVHSDLFGAVAVPASTDADGYLVIEMSDLPDGFINQHAGDFTITVYDETEPDADLTACTPYKLLLAKYFDNVSIHAKHGDAVKSTIACVLPDIVVSE